MGSPSRIISPSIGNSELIRQTKLKAFAVEYITNGYKHRKAAESLGMDPGAGIRMLRDPGMAEMIAVLAAERSTTAVITKDMVESIYLTLLPKLLGEEEVPLITPGGDQYTAKKFHSGELVSIMRDISKATGFIAPEETAAKGAVNIQINVGDMGSIEVIPE